MIAGGALLGAAVVLLVAAGVTIATSHDPIAIFDAILDLFDGIYAGLLGYHLLTDASWDNNYASSDDLNAVLFAQAAVTSAVNSGLAILAQIAKLGWLGKALQDVALPAAIEAAKTAATGGFMGIMLRLVLEAAKGFVGIAVTAASQFAMSFAMGAKYTFDQNLNMDLETWCGQHDGVCTTPPKNTY